MNQQQWRIICTGALLGAVVAFAVPGTPLTVYHTETRLTPPPNGGAFVIGDTLEVRPRGFSLLLVTLVTVGFAIAQRDTKRTPEE